MLMLDIRSGTSPAAMRVLMKSVADGVTAALASISSMVTSGRSATKASATSCQNSRVRLGVTHTCQAISFVPSAAASISPAAKHTPAPRDAHNNSVSSRIFLAIMFLLRPFCSCPPPQRGFRAAEGGRDDARHPPSLRVVYIP